MQSFQDAPNNSIYWAAWIYDSSVIQHIFTPVRTPACDASAVTYKAGCNLNTFIDFKAKLHSEKNIRNQAN